MIKIKTSVGMLRRRAAARYCFRLTETISLQGMAATQEHLIHGHTYRLRAKLYNKTVFVRNTMNETEETNI